MNIGCTLQIQHVLTLDVSCLARSYLQLSSVIYSLQVLGEGNACRAAQFTSSKLCEQVMISLMVCVLICEFDMSVVCRQKNIKYDHLSAQTPCSLQPVIKIVTVEQSAHWRCHLQSEHQLMLQKLADLVQVYTSSM